jgi:radical SAM superfamily enzyme YgiQ (UPF0313 family)
MQMPPKAEAWPSASAAQPSLSSTAPQVLYIHPSKQGVDFDPGTQPMGRPYGLIPVGVIALANLLQENGFQVCGVDYPLERLINKQFSLRDWLKEHDQARLVMIDLHWYEHCYGAIQTAKVCKGVLPDALTLLGGLTTSAYAKDILRDFPFVDLAIRGDAEKPLLELVRVLFQPGQPPGDTVDLRAIPNLSYRQGNEIIENERSYCATEADLDRLNFVDMGFLEHSQRYYRHQYTIPGPPQDFDFEASSGHFLSISRGCDRDCSYCGGSRTAQRTLAGREGIVARSPAKIAQDLKRLEQLGIKQVSLTFDIVMLGDAYWQELFSEMGRLGIKIGLVNEFYQLAPEAFIEELTKRSVMKHSCVALSPLSGADKVRRLNGKTFTDEGFWHTMATLKKHGVPLLVYFSLNLPGETEQTFEKTLALAEKVYSFYPLRLLRIINSYHTVDPLAPMGMHPEKYGIEVSMSSFADFYRYCELTCCNEPGARTGMHRGYRSVDPRAGSLQAMADKWDARSVGREVTWAPLPPGW